MANRLDSLAGTYTNAYLPGHLMGRTGSVVVDGDQVKVLALPKELLTGKKPASSQRRQRGFISSVMGAFNGNAPARARKSRKPFGFEPAPATAPTLVRSKQRHIGTRRYGMLKRRDLLLTAKPEIVTLSGTAAEKIADLATMKQQVTIVTNGPDRGVVVDGKGRTNARVLQNAKTNTEVTKKLETPKPRRARRVKQKTVTLG